MSSASIIDKLEPLPARGEHISWIDYSKSVLIFLVVFGHFDFADLTIHDFIYTFHVPAFLVITGYLVGRKLDTTTWGEFFLRVIYPYAIYYIFFTLISSLIFVLGLLMLGKFTVGLNDIWRVVFASQTYGEYYFHKNTPLWYFPLLFSSLLVFNTLGRSAAPIRAVGYLVMLSIPFVMDNSILPWCLAASGYGALFIAIGDLVRRRRFDQWLFSQISVITSLLLAVGLACFLSYTAVLNGKVNLNLLLLGESKFLFVLNACLGAAMIMILSSLFRDRRLITIIAQSTLYVFSFHIYLVKAMNALFDKLHIGGELFINFLGASLTLFICVSLSVFFSSRIDAVLSNFLPKAKQKFVAAP